MLWYSQESESSPKLFSLELQVSDLQFGLINMFRFISYNQGNIHTGGGEYNTCVVQTEYGYRKDTKP